MDETAEEGWLGPWVEGAWLEKRENFKEAPGCSGGSVNLEVLLSLTERTTERIKGGLRTTE